MTFSFGTYNFTKDHVSVLNYFRIDDICKIEMFDNNNNVEIIIIINFTGDTANDFPKSFKVSAILNTPQVYLKWKLV